MPLKALRPHVSALPDRYEHRVDGSLQISAGANPAIESCKLTGSLNTAKAEKG